MKPIIAIISLLIGTQLFAQESFSGESNLFTIDTKDPVVTLTTPNGGESYQGTDEISVTWEATDDGMGNNPISIYGNVNNGEFGLLESGLPNSGAGSASLPYAQSTEGRIKVVARDAFGNTGSDESDGYFSFSRIGGSAFSVFVTPQYDGDQHPDIVGQFISGIDAMNTFTVIINTPPGIGTISNVDFILDGVTTSDNNSTDGWSADLNMGTLTDDAILTVQAFDVNGFASEIKAITIDVVPIPSWILELGYEYLPEFSDGDYLVGITFPSEDAFNFESSIPDDVILMGGLQNNLDAHLNLQFGANVNGNAVVGGGGDISGNIMSTDSDEPNLNGEIEILATLNSDWSLQEVNASGNAAIGFPIPEVGTSWTVYPYGVPITISLDLGGEITANVDMSAVVNQSLEFLEGTQVTPGLEVAIDATATVSLLYGAAEVAMISHPTAVIQITIYYTTADGSSHTWNGSFVVPYELVGSLGWGLFSGVIYESQLPAGQDAWTFGDPSLTRARMNTLLSRRELIMNSIPDVMPSPSLAMNNSGQGMLVYMKDIDPVQGSPNPEVYYSVWDGEAYSDPLALTDNVYYETNPSVEFLPNGDALCLWTQNKTLESETIEFADMLANQELYYSIWDATSDTWSTPSALTDDGFADGMSKMSVADDTTAISVWTHIESVSSHAPEDWEIYFSVWDGFDWTPAAGLTDDEAADLDGTVVYLNDGTALSVWISDADHDFDTEDDLELKYALWDGTSWSSPVPITDNEYKEGKPHLAATSDGNAYLSWTSNELQADSSKMDRIYISKWDHSLTQWSTQVVVASDSQFVETPELSVTTIGSTENLALMWRGYDGYDGDLFVSFHALPELLSTWTEPEQITTDSLTDWMLSTTIDANSNMVFVNMKTDYADNTDQMFRRGNFFDGLNVTARGINSLRETSEELNYGLLEIKPDLKLEEEDIHFFRGDNDIEFGAIHDTIRIEGMIKNAGAVESADFDVAFHLGHPDSSNSTEIETITVSGLMPDSSSIVFIDWIVNSGGIHDVFMDIDPSNVISEKRELNNTVGKTLSILPDIIAGELSYSHEGIVTGDTLTIAAIVSNQGGFEAINLPYIISYDETVIPELAGVIDTLSIGESDTLSVNIVTLAGARSFEINFDAENAIVELDEDNNAASIPVGILPDYELLADDISVIADTGFVSLIVAEIRNVGAANGNLIPVMVYEGNPLQGGVLLDSLTIQTLAAGDTIQIISAQILDPGIHSIYVRVNDQLTQAEYDYNNNFASDNFLIRSKADLVIGSGDILVSNGNPSIGDTNLVQIRVHNTGGTDALNVSVDFFETDPALETSVASFSTVVPLINLEDSVYVLTELVIADSAYGEIALWAVVDGGNAILETDESSNQGQTILSFYPEIAISQDSLYIDTEMDLLTHELTFHNDGNTWMSLNLSEDDGSDILTRFGDKGNKGKIIEYSWPGLSLFREDVSWFTFFQDSSWIAPGDSMVVELIFDPTDMSYGYYSTELTITSNDLESSTIAFPIQMLIPGIAPILDMPDNIEMLEDGELTYSLDTLVFDADDLDSLLTWEIEYITGEDSVFLVNLDENRILRFNAISDWYGSVQIELTAIDPFELYATDTISIDVLSVNDGPTIDVSLGTTAVHEDDFAAIAIPRLEDFFNDIDADEHLSFVGLVLDEGLDSLSFINTSTEPLIAGMLGRIGKGVSIKRLAVENSLNEGPVLLSNSRPGSQTENPKNKNPRQIAPLGRQPNMGGEIQFTHKQISTSSTGANEVMNNRELADSTVLIVYPSVDFTGDIRILVTGTDDSLASVSDTLLLTVLPINDPPLFSLSSDSLVFNEDFEGPQMITVIPDSVALDEQSQIVLYSIQPDTVEFVNVSIEVATGAVSIDAVDDSSGFAEFTVTANDGQSENNLAVATFSLEIQSVNDAPAPFSLSSPSTETQFMDVGDTLQTFAWEYAGDAEGDSVTYYITFFEAGLDTAFSAFETGTTELSLNVEDFPRDVWVEWDVFASDGVDTTWCAAPWVVKVSSVVGIDEIALPEQFTLKQNYPNPFNPTTTIRYGLPESSEVTLTIYDILGREVIVLVDGNSQNAGWYEVYWNGLDKYKHLVETGLYFAVIELPADREIIKMLLLK